MNLLPIIIFITSYLLFILLPKRRSLVAVLAGALLILTRCISWREAFLAVNWNVLGIFVGTLILADSFMASRVPAVLAEIIVDKSRNTCWAILWLCFFTGFISAFVENVATVLIVAPVALSLARKIKLNPVNMMIAIAVTSNLQGAATLIGDPPSMLLAGFARLNFIDFFFYRARPSIFFAVELGAVASFLVLFFIFRKEKDKVKLVAVEKVISWFPTVLLITLIILLALSSLFDPEFKGLAGIICLFIGIVSLLADRLIQKKAIIHSLRSLDWDTTFFLLGVFVLVGGLTISGWINVLAKSIAHLVGGNKFSAYTFLVFISVVISAFVDNVPFLAAMLPVALKLSGQLNLEPTLLLFGLLIGVSLGGNITPIGASANIVSCGLLKKEGYQVSFRDFSRIGIPFTLAAVTVAYIFIWIVWSK